MHKPCVLLAEDDENQRHLYAIMLQMNGYDVREAVDGKEALAEVLRSKPDVILTDIAMPGMDGMEFIKAVKGEEIVADVPIVVMTAFPGQFLDLAEEVGAEVAIAKPFKPDELCHALQKALPPN